MLAKIPGEFIAAGSKQFPTPNATASKALTVELEAAHHGMVRIHYRLMSSRDHRSVNWYWLAHFAEKIDARR